MDINEIFGKNIIQGEGPFAGRPATFIRTFGCVKPYCGFCDTKYSFCDREKECKEMSPIEILDKVKEFGNHLVVITGGEPYIQKEIYELISYLSAVGYVVQMETSGKAKIETRVSRETIVMSPKQYNGEFIVYDERALVLVDYFKFVVETADEMNNVLTFIELNHLPKEKIYLMPKGATREEQIKNSGYVINQCCEHNFIYGPRLHVLLNDNKRGV